MLKVKPNEEVTRNLSAALLTQAKIYYAESDYNKALPYFEKAAEVDKQNGYPLYMMARIYRQQEDTAKAGEYYEKAISLSPSNLEYSSEYADFISEAYNKELEAKPVEDTPPLETSSADDNISIVTVTFEDENAPKTEVDKQYQKLLGSADKNYKNKEYDLALTSYKEALSLNPTDEKTLLKIGNVYRAQKDNKNASSYYKKAILTDINYADAWFNLGLVNAEEKNTDEAIKAFRKVVDIDPTYSYAYFALGIAYESQNNVKEAVKNYQAFLQYSDDSNTMGIVREKLQVLQ